MHIVCFVGDYGICTDSENNVMNIPRNKIKGYGVGDKIPYDVVAENIKANDKNDLKNFSENSKSKDNNDVYVFDDVIIELNVCDKAN